MIIPADPKPGLEYRQEYLEGEAEDNGEVLSTRRDGRRAGRPLRKVLLTKDTITIEPDVLEYKLYAPGVGAVLVFGVSGGAGREELVKRSTVSADVAARAATPHSASPTAELRASALRLSADLSSGLHSEPALHGCGQPGCGHSKHAQQP